MQIIYMCANPKIGFFNKIMLLVVVVLGMAFKGSGQVIVPWVDNSNSTDFYNPSNWNPNTNFNGWVTTDIAQFNNTGTATTAGIDMSKKALSIGAIEMTALRTRSLTIGNSSPSSAPLTLNGVIINSITNTIIRNASVSLLTLQDNEMGTGNIMGIVLANATNNVINIDGAGDISIGCIISGANPLTKSGTGAGVLILTAANSYTGITTINRGTLQLNRNGGNTLPAGNDVLVSSGGTLRISKDQTLKNVTLAAGANLVVDGSVTLTITGTLTVHVGATVSGAGAIVYSGTGALVYNGIGSRIANIEWPSTTYSVTINSGAEVTLNANKAMPSFLLSVIGFLDVNTFSSSGTCPNFSITGTVRTANTNGLINTGASFTGYTGTTFSSALGSTSTIDYNALSGTQIINGAVNYINLKASGGGTKTISSATSVSGLITISDAAILNAQNFSLGGNGGSGTNLTMTGTSRYITAGTSTKPDATGTYTLAPTSTIEFSNNAGTQQDIRLSVNYGNVDISGSNVGLSSPSSSLNMQALTTFKVTSTGTFNVQNTNGFTGSILTAINNTYNPTILLQEGGTINYNGTSQLITNTISYQNLTFSNSGVKTAPITLSILGNLSRSGTHTFSAGTGLVSFAGTALQIYTAAALTFPINFYNVTNTNTVGLQLDSTIGIQNEFNLAANAKLNLNTGDINMRSTSARTAYITNLGTTLPSTNITYGATGRFNIERFLQSIKSWRLLATPIDSATSPTISASWREGELIGTNTATGFGTRITGPSGLDETTQRASMKYYNMATNSYIDINASALSRSIARDAGYYVFVRGDRGVAVGGTTGTTNLRIRGRLRTGNQSFTVVKNIAPASGFQSVGNPYASQIDVRNFILASGGVSESFYIWNPTGGDYYGVGQFEAYVRTGSDFRRNGSAGGAILNTIESGQAVFLQNNSTTTNGSVTIKESDKASGSSLVSRSGVTTPTFEINLLTNNTAGIESIVDGASINFDENYSNSLNNDDVRKISNTNDNVGIKQEASNLVVERRKTLASTDTIRLNIGGMRVASYKFEIDPSVLGNLPLNAFLTDKFLLTETPVSLTEVTNVPFSITSDAASRVADRFMIVFRPGGTLPVNFTNISAEKNADKTNTVKWNCVNEINISNYHIQSSANGTGFTAIGTTASASNNGNSAAYNFVDVAPFNGVNYYRIKAISANGQVQYSSIVKVTAQVVGPQFAVQPNPVINKILNINFENMQGNYSIKLVSKQGATVFTKQVTVAGLSEVKNIAVNAVATGVYDVLLVDAKGKQFVQTIFIQ